MTMGINPEVAANSLKPSLRRNANNAIRLFTRIAIPATTHLEFVLARRIVVVIESGRVFISMVLF